MSETLRITVAICTRNRAAFLAPAARSVLPQLNDASELLIIDNGSTDNTRDVIAALAKENARVRSFYEAMPGISQARNAALREARGDWVLFFDDDEIAPPKWMATYFDFLSRHAGGRPGAVGGGYEPQFDGPPPKWFNVARARFDLGEMEHFLSGRGSLWGGNTAYKRAVALELGGFNTSLARTEDTDLNMRLQKGGYEVWWLPGNAITHLLPSARITIRSLMRIAFVEGRSYGRLRLLHIDGAANRAVYRVVRLLYTPFYGLFLLLLALVTAPFNSGKTAARSLQRAIRTFGIAWQMLLDIGPTSGG